MVSKVTRFPVVDSTSGLIVKTDGRYSEYLNG